MKSFICKNFLVLMTVIFGSVIAQAQFDDVYYDPDNADTFIGSTSTDDSFIPETVTEEYTYYDDDEYEYYEDDYDYYYSSRIRRFHSPYAGFDYYDPAYVDYHYYDPYSFDSYYYPGSTIYISFGSVSYWDYRRWRRWHRWNSWNTYYSWGNCGINPYANYYSYNNWYGYSNNHYWNGHHGYNSYSNYYNNYYSYCPMPVGNYHGITNTTVNYINSGNNRGTYYGPRISGNTGSSPRGPVDNPGLKQPVYDDRNGVTQTDVTPKPAVDQGIPGRANPSVTTSNGTAQSPGSIPGSRGETPSPGVKQIPVDRELKREESPNADVKRPVFRPDADRYRPYPNDDIPERPTGQRTDTEKPTYKPSTPGRSDAPVTRENYTPRPSPEKPTYAPNTGEVKPSYRPNSNSQGRNDRPSYTPPPTRNNDQPAYQPPSRGDSNSRSDERPANTPPPRQQDSGSKPERPSYSPPPRSNDGPSYSPPPRSNSGGSDAGRSSSSPSKSDSSSGGRSSGSQSSGSSSPRGRG